MEMELELDPEVKGILAFMPKSPSIRSMPVAQYRKLMRTYSSMAPRHGAAIACDEDRVLDLEGQSIPVRIYTPNGVGPFPLIAYFHGGGYVIGDLDISDAICREMCSAVEAVVVSVDYRLAPEHPFPAANDDCWSALRWVAAHGAEVNGDPTRLVVAGDSAGANLAAAMTLRARDRGGPNIVAQFLMYPAPQYPEWESGSWAALSNAPLLTTDDAKFYWEQYLPDETARQDPDAFPIQAASLGNLPPAFIGIGGCDPARDGGMAYADALTAAGVQVAMRDYAGMPHGFYNLIGFSKVAASAMAEACDWLKTQLARP